MYTNYDTLINHVSLPKLFYSFFKSLVGKEVTVELKNDLRYVAIINILISFHSTSYITEHKYMQLLSKHVH